MPRKKIMTAKELTSQMTGMRLSKHEAICAERMKTLFKAIDEMRKDIKVPLRFLLYPSGAT